MGIVMTSSRGHSFLSSLDYLSLFDDKFQNFLRIGTFPFLGISQIGRKMVCQNVAKMCRFGYLKWIANFIGIIEIFNYFKLKIIKNLISHIILGRIFYTTQICVL